MFSSPCPPPGDRTWNVPVNGNAQALDALAPVGALAVVTTEVPSATLNVQWRQETISGKMARSARMPGPRLRR